MKTKIAAIPEHAESLLSENGDDASGVGVNYADAVLKAMKTTLEDGRKVLAKRRGLKITLKIGHATGEGLMRRLEHGPDPREILRHALMEAGEAAGVDVEIKDDQISLLP